MTIASIDESQRKAARAAGALGIFTAGIAIFAFYGIHARLTVPGDMGATAANILANETLFRIGVACYLMHSIAVVALAVALYVILRPVSPGVAALAALWRVASALTWALASINLLDVVRTLRGAGPLGAFEPDQVLALASVAMGRNFETYYVGLPFWGLASAAFFYLFLKSRFIPRVLAIGGLISSAWCAASGMVFLISPAFGDAVNLYTLDSPMGFFELATSLWLLFKGLKPGS